MKKRVTKKEGEEIRKSGKISIVEGSFYGVMDGFGFRYITPYALALGASNFLIGLITTVPVLLGNFFQLHTLHLLKERSRKYIVYMSVLIQALLWILVIYMGIQLIFFPSTSSFIPLLLLIAYSILVIAGSVATPAWNSWMKDLILINKGKYFGKRNRIVNIVTVFSMLIAGFILTWFTGSRLLIGFFIIFSVAFLGRLASAALIKKQYEPKFYYEHGSYFSLKDFIKGMFYNNFGRFVIFITLFSFATNVAGPFFAVYMLETLNLSYIQFTIVTVSSVVTMILFLPKWGEFSDKYGNVTVLKISSMLIPLIPFLWLLTFQFRGSDYLLYYLVPVEFFSGFFWAGFNLAAGNFIYDAVTREKMAFCVAYFNIINSIGSFIGGLIGGIIALSNTVLGINVFLFLFILSGILRLAVPAVMHNLVREVREVPQFSLKQQVVKRLNTSSAVIWRYIGFNPIRLEN